MKFLLLVRTGIAATLLFVAAQFIRDTVKSWISSPTVTSGNSRPIQSFLARYPLAGQAEFLGIKIGLMKMEEKCFWDFSILFLTLFYGVTF